MVRPHPLRTRYIRVDLVTIRPRPGYSTALERKDARTDVRQHPAGRSLEGDSVYVFKVDKRVEPQPWVG